MKHQTQAVFRSILLATLHSKWVGKTLNVLLIFSL